MSETDRTGDQAVGIDVEEDVPEPPFTWHAARVAAFTIQRDLADAAMTTAGSDEWNDGLLNASMYYRVPARTAEELRRLADLADDLAKRLAELAAASDDYEAWDGFDPEAVDLSAMTAAVLQFGIFIDAVLVGLADQERERISDLANAAFDSAFRVWNADKHDLAETLLGHLLVLLGKEPGAGRTYLHRWLLLTEFTARAITGDLAAKGALNAVGLGADLVSRAEALGVTDSTDTTRRQAIAQAEHDQATRRSEFATWAGAILADAS
ncbi:hypothetical protein ABZW03_09190 [Kitasatospora sp. NPDC004799]|uniref:hypothetical protein n=1 Tax=Kitasatospora sp. NPDC004799 TaxID=3154460 RepID=UPI0033B3034B